MHSYTFIPTHTQHIQTHLDILILTQTYNTAKPLKYILTCKHTPLPRHAFNIPQANTYPPCIPTYIYSSSLKHILHPSRHTYIHTLTPQYIPTLIQRQTHIWTLTYIPKYITHIWLMSKHMGKPKQKDKTFRVYTVSSQDAKKHHEYLRIVCIMLPSTEAAYVTSHLHWSQNSGHCPFLKEAFISRVQHVASSGSRCGSILLNSFCFETACPGSHREAFIPACLTFWACWKVLSRYVELFPLWPRAAVFLHRIFRTKP